MAEMERVEENAENVLPVHGVHSSMCVHPCALVISGLK